MNICFFAHHSISGKDGASLSMLSIAENLASEGNNIYIIYPNHPQNVSHHKGIKNLYLRNFSMRRSLDDSSIVSSCIYQIKDIYNNLLALYIAKKMKKYKIDIIHINGIDNCIGAQYALYNRIPYVWHIRQFLEEDLHCTPFNKRKMYRYMARASQIIGISKAVCEKYKRILKRDIQLIYNGVEPEKYILPTHAFGSEPYTMILPGRITKEKGQFDAVKALCILIKKGIEIELLLVGYGVDDYCLQIKRYVKENHIEKYVKFIDYTDDLRQLRKAADIGLVCSIKEAFGRVTIENFFGKLLCIGANAGGTAELIKDGYNGILYKSGDYKDLAEKIETIIHEDEKKNYTDMIERAYQEAMEKYTTNRLIKEIKQIYSLSLQKNDNTEADKKW